MTKGRFEGKSSPGGPGGRSHGAIRTLVRASFVCQNRCALHNAVGQMGDYAKTIALLPIGNSRTRKLQIGLSREGRTRDATGTPPFSWPSADPDGQIGQKITVSFATDDLGHRSTMIEAARPLRRHGSTDKLSRQNMMGNGPTKTADNCEEQGVS